MMIKYLNTDILSINQGVIVHGCNCLGYFNAGVAKQIRNKYPTAYQDYLNNYSISRLGDIIISNLSKDLIIIHALTQATIGRDQNKKYVSYDAIFEAFNKINSFCLNQAKLNTVYFPKIGAGLGGGNWSIIEKIIDTNLKDVDNKICCVI